MRLRSHLFVLILATALPLLAFGLVASALLVRHQEDNFAAAVKDRNRAFMSAVDAELNGSILALEALGASRNLARGDLEAFLRDARAVLATQPSWRAVILQSPDGRQLVNTLRPWGTPLPLQPVEPRSLERAVRMLRPVVSSVLTVGRIVDGYGILVRVPVTRDGQAAYILTTVLRPESFESLIRSQRLPEGWASGLVDAEGRLIARIPSKPAGTVASEDYRAAVKAAPEGWYRGRTIEGADTYTAHVTSALSGWSVGFAIPASLVNGGAKHAAWLMGGGVLVSLAVALGLALWLGRRIAKPMSALAGGAARMGSAEPPPEVRSSVREVNDLSDALANASHMIREREAELRRRAVELQEADTNKSQFLAVLSHELRNPLAPLLNGLSLLRLTSDAQAAADTRAMMERQITQLRRLIDDLLDVSRIDRGKLELRRERIGVDAIVRSAIETAQPGIEAKSHELLVRYAPESLHVDGDPVRLGQAVANLLNNAAKFTPAGGRIEISTRAESGEAVISVKDTGIGFVPGEEARVFDMFVQLDSSRAQAPGGLGLGLTLVRSLVAMHGGTVEGRSAGAGRGAEFIVRLPLSGAAAPRAKLPPPRLAARTARRVLVVDDNNDAADSLAQILCLEGFEARACYDAESALALTRELRPEVAFLDLNMPGMSGLELAPKLRALSGNAAIRLIALTGMGQKTDVEATRAAGFDAHLTKPAAAQDVLRLASADEIEKVIPWRYAGPTSPR